MDFVTPENTYPIAALFGTEDDSTKPNTSLDRHPSEIINEADLIFGVDVMTRNQFLLYGRNLLQQIVESEISEPCHVIAIELDQETDELEKIIALVEVIKGSCDYQSND